MSQHPSEADEIIVAHDDATGGAYVLRATLSHTGGLEWSPAARESTEEAAAANPQTLAPLRYWFGSMLNDTNRNARYAAAIAHAVKAVAERTGAPPRVLDLGTAWGTGCGSLPRGVTSTCAPAGLLFAGASCGLVCA